MTRSPNLPVLILAAALAAVQAAAAAAGRDYYLVQLTMAAYYTIVVLALTLVMGYAGQVSMGHGAFFALGGYASAILTTTDVAAAHGAAWGRALQSAGVLVARRGLGGGVVVAAAPWAAFLAGLALTFAVALLIGYPALRLKGHYLAMATLGFGLIVYRVVIGSDFTGASDGIHGVPPWPLPFGGEISGETAARTVNFYVAWGATLGVLVLLLNLVRSRPGRALRAIHDGELAANAMGVDTASYKLRAFVLSALLAAAAGSLFTHFNGGIGPSEAGAMKSVRYVALVAAGGMANLWGALGMSAVLNFLSLRGCFGSYDEAVFGAILIAIVSLAPEGPLAPLAAWLRRRVPRRAPARAGAAPAAR
jgi:branched-chain amino acid transport system permease protein